MKNIIENEAFWSRAFQVGIDKRMLESNGYMDILLAGDETPGMDLRLRHNEMIIWMNATLQLVEGESGEMEIAVRAKIEEEGDDET